MTTNRPLGPDLCKVNNIVSSIDFIINITCVSSIFIHSFIHSRFMPPNTKATTTAVVNPDVDATTSHRHPLDNSRQMGAANIADR
jgi:hypothetical protein